MSNKIYMLDINDDVDAAFTELQNTWSSNEVLVSTAVADKKLIVTTEISSLAGRPKNLLLDEIDRGKIPASVLGIPSK